MRKDIKIEKEDVAKYFEKLDEKVKKLE